MKSTRSNRTKSVADFRRSSPGGRGIDTGYSEANYTARRRRGKQKQTSPCKLHQVL